MNLWQETEGMLRSHGLSLTDVEFVDMPSGWATIEQFKAVAEDINYDPGYGIEEISCHLRIVGRDWWLDRREYDGSEWWEYHQRPQRPENHVAEVTKAMLVSSYMTEDEED